MKRSSELTSNEFAGGEANPCGSGTWKKSSGRPPDPFGRVALTVARTACNVGIIAAPVVVGCRATTSLGCVRFQAFAHVLYSAMVIGWVTPPEVSLVISVGKVPSPLGVLPVLR